MIPSDWQRRLLQPSFRWIPMQLLLRRFRKTEMFLICCRPTHNLGSQIQRFDSREAGFLYFRVRAYSLPVRQMLILAKAYRLLSLRVLS